MISRLGSVPTYGTPIYITIEERNKIHVTNLNRHPQLAVQRDIFVFQCLIGCRIGDFLKLKKSNYINGGIEYTPHKTKDGRPETVREPLNDTAKAILEKYKDCEGDRLLPFISEQKYNVSTKRIFKAAGGGEAYRYGAECENGAGGEADIVRGGIVAYGATNLYRQLV